MMKGYLDTSDTSTTTVQVSNLPSSFTSYDVYVYSDGDNGGNGRTAIVTMGTKTIHVTDAPFLNFFGTFTQAADNVPGNYAVFPASSGSGFTITVKGTSTDGVPRGPLNGMQIVVIP